MPGVGKGREQQIVPDNSQIDLIDLLADLYRTSARVEDLLERSFVGIGQFDSRGASLDVWTRILPALWQQKVLSQVTQRVATEFPEKKDQLQNALYKFSNRLDEKFVSSISAKLESRRRAGKPPASKEPPVAYGGFVEAAAVLVSFDVETLKPVPGVPVEDTRDRLIVMSLPYLEGESSRRWTLQPEARIAALRQLRLAGRVQAALDANPERSSDPVQKSLEAYLTGTARPVGGQPLVEITALQQVAGWVGPAGFEGVPDLAAIQRRAEWLKLLQPFEHLAGDFFRGRASELARLRSYVGVVPPGSRLESPGTMRRKRGSCLTSANTGLSRTRVGE